MSSTTLTASEEVVDALRGEAARRLTRVLTYSTTSFGAAGPNTWPIVSDVIWITRSPLS
jgi:hypothetical protein